MNIAIADDNAADQQELAALLKRYCSENRLSAQYTFFPDAEALLKAFSPGAYDLIFLDIYMRALDGMSAAHRLREADPDVRLIFYTSSAAHAVESYEVRAAYYLTKPLEYARVQGAMDAACAELVQRSRSIRVHVQGVEAELMLQNILYVDCSRECAQLHLADKTLPVSERISDLLAQLTADGRFLVCNRNVAVNMDAIARVTENDFVLVSGEAVPIRQRGRSAVRKEFLRYSLRTL